MATELFRIPIDDLKSNDDVNPDIRSIAVRNNKLYIAVNDDRSPGDRTHRDVVALYNIDTGEQIALSGVGGYLDQLHTVSIFDDIIYMHANESSSNRGDRWQATQVGEGNLIFGAFLGSGRLPQEDERLDTVAYQVIRRPNGDILTLISTRDLHADTEFSGTRIYTGEPINRISGRGILLTSKHESFWSDGEIIWYVGTGANDGIQAFNLDGFTAASSFDIARPDDVEQRDIIDIDSSQNIMYIAVMDRDTDEIVMFLAPIPGREIPPKDSIVINNQSFDKFLQARVKLGRGTSYAEQVRPLAGQIILNNVDDSANNLRRGHKVEYLNAANEIIYAGWVKDVNFTKSPTGAKRAFVTLEGSLGRLSREQWEFAVSPLLNDPDDSPYQFTGRIMETILEDAGWPSGKRNIDKGQFELYIYNMAGVLSTRRLQTPLRPIRELERTEWGLITEGHGDRIDFQGRYFREFDNRQPKYNFTGPGVDGGIEVIGVTPYDSNQGEIITHVRYSAQGAEVFQQTDTDGDTNFNLRLRNPVAIASLDRADINLDLQNGVTYGAMGAVGESNINMLPYVTSVVNWQPFGARNIAIFSETGQQIQPEPYAHNTGVFVSFEYNRLGVRVSVTNNTFNTIQVREINVTGRPVVNTDTLAFEDVASPDADQYDPQSFEIKSLVDLGIEAGRDRPITRAALREAAEVILWRLGVPRPIGSISVDLRRYPILLTGLEMSDPVAVLDVVGLPTGEYHVEGWEFEFLPERDTITIDLSRRGARTILADASTIGTVNAPAGSPVLIGVRASGTGSLEIMVDGTVARRHAVSGDPDRYTHFLSASESARTVTARVTGANVLRWQVVSLDR